MAPKISIVVPLLNEGPNVAPLARQITVALGSEQREFEMAFGSSRDLGEAGLHLGVADPHSALRPQVGTALSGKTIRVQVQTLDWAIEQTAPKELEFVSIDVKGMELEVLHGFDLGRWRPKLLVIEDMSVNHQKHRYLRNRDYKPVRRTRYNNLKRRRYRFFRRRLSANSSGWGGNSG